MRVGTYILKHGMPVEEPDLLTWSRWFENADAERTVAQTQVSPDVLVSTVFLGLDHNWGEGPPILWETMIFGGPQDGYQERYSARAAAEAGHLDAVEIAQGTRQPQ